MADQAAAPRPVRALWWVTVITALPLGLLAFAELAAGPSERVLIQGPLVVDPTMGERLGTVLSVEFLHWSQIGIHIVGFILFIGLGLLIASRSNETTPMVAAAMLVAVGSSLFAPSGQLSGFWGRAASVVGVVAESGASRYWISFAGILILGFLLIFCRSRPTGLEWTGLAALAVLGLVTSIFPGWALDPARMGSPFRQVFTAGVPMVVLGRAWWNLPALSRERRIQVRPVLLAFTLILVTLAVLILLRPSLRTDAFGLVLATPRLQALYGINTLLLSTVAVFALPVSIVLAVVRYRLFEIDVLINRALVYGSLTGIATLLVLVVTLTISATAGGVLGSGLTGQNAALAGVVTGTVMAVGLQPVRRRLQASIDRRFYRDKFSAEQALERFAERIASVVDRQVLVGELDTLLGSTLQPVTVRMIPIGELEQTLARVLEEGEPVAYPLASTGVAVPLVGSAGLAGAVLLGPRKAGIPYRGLELEFLQRVGDRVGPALRIVEMVEKQEATRRQSERVEQELAVARRIQRQLLPNKVPEPRGWSFNVFYEPAREVGGDFYDFYELGEDRLGIVVGDVTDKGMPAALVMASCRTVLRGVALSNRDLLVGEVLRQANELLVGDIPEGMFITCLYGVLDADTGRFLFANAGHNPPVVCRSGSTEMVMARGMPLGLMSGMDYEPAEVVLGRRETLVLSSDGITEAHAPDGEMFGFGRFAQSLLDVRMGAIEKLLASQRLFSGAGWEQEDDITLIALTRH